jgi:hypothetical protein
VLVHDLQECTEAASGRMELGSYELHDLVSVDAHTVGIIVKIERDAFKVLGTIRWYFALYSSLSLLVSVLFTSCHGSVCSYFRSSLCLLFSSLSTQCPSDCSAHFSALSSECHSDIVCVLCR